MLFSRIPASRICQLLAALVIISMPASAAIELDKTTVTLQYEPNTPSDGIVETVRVSGAGAITVDPPTHNVFDVRASGENVNIGLDRARLSQLINPVVDPIINATVTVRSGSESAVINLVLKIGKAENFTLSTTSMSFQAALGSTLPMTQTVDVTGGGGFTASSAMDNGSGWLLISSTTGKITVQVSAAGLATGTYIGKVTVTPQGVGAEQEVTVTLTVGGTLSVSPASLQFAYTAGGLLPVQRQVSISSTIAADFHARNSGESWLFVNGKAADAGAMPATLNISVNPIGLSAGTYPGTVVITGSDNSVAYVPVSLTVNSGSAQLSVSPASLEFSAQVGGGEFKQLTISTTASGVFYNAASTVGWLRIQNPSGQMSYGSLTMFVEADARLLVAGTHYGTIEMTFGGGVNDSRSIPVSFTVGGSTIPIETAAVNPRQLVFYMHEGLAAQLPTQEFAVTGAAGSSFSVSSAAGSWLTIVGDNSGVVPGKVMVGIDPAAASALAAGIHNGEVRVQTSAGILTVGVVLNIAPGTVLLANPSAITEILEPGKTIPARYINVTSSKGTPLTYTVSTTTSWLQLFLGSPATSTTPNYFLLAINPSGLPPGPNTGSITLTASGASYASITVPVTVVVTGSQGVLANPASLTFAAPLGGSPAAKTLALSATTAGTFTASATPATWLSVSPASGSTPSNVTVSVDSSLMPAGTHHGTVTIASGGQVQEVPVTLTVGGAPLGGLEVENVSLTFDYLQGDEVPGVQGIKIASSGGMLDFTAAAESTGNWLRVEPVVDGRTPTTLRVLVNPQGLGPDTYTGKITITAPGAANSPQVRTVTLKVRGAPKIAVAPTSLSFTYRNDGALPGPQNLTVSSSGDLNFSTTSNAAWLKTTPEQGTTPGTLKVEVNVAGLNPGSYNGRITILTTGATPESTAIVEVALTITAPLPTIEGIANAASYQDGAVSPGEIVTLFGNSMGPAKAAEFVVDGSGMLATTLADVRVLFNGVPGPLVYVSAGQISAIVPYSVAAPKTSVWLEYQGVRSNSLTLDVAAARPALFTADASGSGPGAILNQDYSVNSTSNPAARGSVVMLYLTGGGQTLPNGVDGRVNKDYNNLPRPMLDVTATIDGRPAEVWYAGAAPDMVSGLMQVNVKVPATARAGAVPVVLTFGAISTQQGVTVALQ